jgi:hypothetical protein
MRVVVVAVEPTPGIRSWSYQEPTIRSTWERAGRQEQELEATVGMVATPSSERTWSWLMVVEEEGRPVPAREEPVERFRPLAVMCDVLEVGVVMLPSSSRPIRRVTRVVVEVVEAQVG